MISHHITIVKKDDVVPIPELMKHPLVVKIIEIPFDYILFEFYHDLIIQRWSLDPRIKNAASLDNELKAEYDRVIKEKMQLLQPLYDKEDAESENPRFITGFGFHINNIFYDFNSIKKTVPVDFRLMIDNVKTNALNMQIETFLKTSEESRKEKYFSVLSTWHEWGIELGNIKAFSHLESCSNKSVITEIEFIKEIEDTIAGLIIMLTDTKRKTNIEYLNIILK